MKRSTIAAVLVLAALGGYIFWFEREPRPASDLERMFDVDGDSIERIEVESGDDGAVVVERRGGEWRLVSPVEAEADGIEVDLLTQNLATMELERAVAKASEVDLADFGLEAPRIEVRFRTREGDERSLAFGRDTPTPGNQYALRDGDDEILVVPSHLSLNFDKTAWELRDKSVYDVEAEAEPRRIAMVRPEGNLVLEQENGLWRLTEPLRARADPYRAASLASRLRTLEMAEIVAETPEALDAYGLEDPERSIRIELEGREGRDPRVLELAIGGRKGAGFYARAPSRAEVFVVDGALVEELDATAAELPSKKLFDFAAFEANRLRIEAKGKKASVFERQSAEAESAWRQVAPEPAREVETSAVEDLLYALNDARAAALLENPALGELGLEEPAFTITVRSKEPPVEEAVAIGKPEGDSVYARRNGEEVALELTREAWSEVESKMSFEPPKEER